MSSGRAARGRGSKDGISLPEMEYTDLERTSRFFQNSGQGIPHSFLSLLCGVIVVSHEFDFIIAGNSLVSALDVSINSRACPGNVLNILRQTVEVTSSSPNMASGSSNEHKVEDDVVSLWVVSLGLILPFWVISPHPLNFPLISPLLRFILPLNPPPRFTSHCRLSLGSFIHSYHLPGSSALFASFCLGDHSSPHITSQGRQPSSPHFASVGDHPSPHVTSQSRLPSLPHFASVGDHPPPHVTSQGRQPLSPNIASSGNDLVPPSSKGSQSLSSDLCKGCQSSCGSTGVVSSSSSLNLAGPCASFGSQPGTSGTSREDFIPDSDNNKDDDSVREDDETSTTDKEGFSKNFKEMISLITGYFPNSKPSVSTDSDDLIRCLDVFG